MKPCRQGIDLSRRAVLVLGASALGTKMSFGQNVMNQPVVLGQVYLSFYAVTGAVVHEVLERLGHTVEVREGPHEQIFPLLGQGVIDVMAAAWLPEGHAAYWARYGTNAIEVAKLYDGARFFLGVPDYVPEHEVSSIADLARPNIAAKMTKLIQGIGLGATITTDAQKAVADYGLDKLGYSLARGVDKRLQPRRRRTTLDRVSDLGAAILESGRQTSTPEGSTRSPWRHEPRLLGGAPTAICSSTTADAKGSVAHRAQPRRRHGDGLGRERREEDAA